MSTRTWRTLGGAAGLSTLLVVALGPAGQAWADGQAPAGNNGTVKINNEATPNQDNDPHVGCSFSVSLYGYDAGAQTARLTFEGQAPTRGSGSVSLSAGWTTAHRTGGNQLDQTVPVSFSQLAGLFKGVAPAHQGYHVKLTADVMLHPGAVLSASLRQRFRRAAEEIYGGDPGFRTRLAAYCPLFGLRWVLILLNEFLPNRWRQRVAAGAGDDWADAKKRQLAKAASMLGQIGECV